MKAWLNLRYTVPDRLKAFVSGIERHGYRAEIGFPDRIGPKDIFLTWNRINMGNVVAQQFQDRGQTVLVAENAAWGNDFLGRRWYSLARDYHNTAGCVTYGGPERWDSLDYELWPFRPSGETVILPQRGIGSPPTRMPAGWAEKAAREYRGRIRPHPGKVERISLEDDLANACVVVTWGSGAAIKASMLGCHLISEMPQWIGEHDGEVERLAMFRRLAWAQWERQEIESGDAFACLLPA